MDSDNATRNAGMRHQMRIYTWEEVGVGVGEGGSDEG